MVGAARAAFDDVHRGDVAPDQTVLRPIMNVVKDDLLVSEAARILREKLLALTRAAQAVFTAPLNDLNNTLFVGVGALHLSAEFA